MQHPKLSKFVKMRYPDELLRILQRKMHFQGETILRKPHIRDEKNAAYSRALGRREGGRGAVEAAALAELRRRREEQLRADAGPQREERAEERDLGSGASDLSCFTNNKVYCSV